MKTFVLIATLALVSLIALPANAAQASCPTDPSPETDIAGLAYTRTAPDGQDEDVPLIYIESNGVAGLQYGGLSAFGWSELAAPCDDGDQLVY